MPSDHQLTAPLAEPLLKADVKAALRIDATDLDDVVDSLIVAARMHIEAICRRVLVRQVRRLVLDAFPGSVEGYEIRVPVSPLRAVESIIYLDSDGTEQTLATSAYRVDAVSDVPRIVPAYNASWPDAYDVQNAVTVTYSAGYVVPVTADGTANTLTGEGHALADDDRVILSNTGGALPTSLSAPGNYYAVGVSGDVFQVATSAGGAAVDFTGAGTGTHFLGAIPQPILQALILLVGHWLENTEAVSIGNPAAVLPFGVEALLGPYRVLRIG